MNTITFTLHDGTIVTVSERLLAILLAVVDQQEQIEGQVSGSIAIDYGTYQARVRVMSAGKTYKFAMQES